jgi:hypothetical protein
MVLRYLIVRITDFQSFLKNKINSKSIFPILFLLDLITCSIFTILKLNYCDKKNIGDDLFMTIIGSLLPIFAQVGLVSYFSVVMNCLQSYTVMMTGERKEILSKHFSMLNKVCMIIPLTCVGFSLLPVIGLQYPMYGSTFAVIYLIGNGLNAWVYGILTASALKHLLYELSNHVNTFSQSSDELKLVIKRLKSANIVVIHNCFNVGLSFIIFGASDFLLTKSTYLFIIHQICCPVGATVLILTVSKISYIPVGSTRILSHRIRSLTLTPLSLKTLLRPLHSKSAPIVPVVGNETSGSSHAPSNNDVKPCDTILSKC